MRLASVQEAVGAIPDGATVAVDGFTLMGVAEALYEGIEQSFRATGHPKDLVIVHAAGQSNRKVGFEHFAVEGLAKRIVGSHWGLMPKMSSFLGAGLAEAVCLPQGQLSSLYRAIAAGRPGNLTRIGLGTFVDPRIESGKVNQPARDHAPDYVSVETIGGEEFMLYRSFKIDVGIFRASAVDEDGNCATDEEAVMLDALAIAQAAHNSGGIVICQAKKLVARGAIVPRQVTVPGALVDLVVQAPDPERQHRQSGVYGGVPAGRVDFGITAHPTAIIPHASQV